ncbi:MAG TPA: hypothetical protein VFS35_02695 [Terrimicrobiaceae bacterium]|nr:hypothetical protein [Terrimicrobiaceae bacterium]
MHEHIDISGDDHAVASWIWRNLVPKNGQASTVQGELLRAVEKLRWEAQENGNINWDDGFLILIDFLEQTLAASGALAAPQGEAMKVDLDRLRNFLPVDELEDEDDSERLPYVDDDLYDRLTHCVVAFARANPTPVPRQPDPRLHR